MKKVKVVSLIIAAVVVVLGVSAGIMYASGVLSSGKAEAFELLMQAPEKINHSAIRDYIGASDMTEAMLDQGLDTSIKYSDMQIKETSDMTSTNLSKYEFNVGLQVDFDAQKAYFDVGAEANDANLSLQAYASLPDKKIALAAPELIKGKVFTLTGSEKGEMAQNIQELIKHLTELKDSFGEYMEEQGESVYKGIVCEKINNGYRLTIPKDVTDSTINSLSEFVKEKKDNIESLEGLLGVEKGSVAAAIDKMIPKLTSDTADFSFEIYENQGNLTGLRADIKDDAGKEIIAFELEFNENGNKSSVRLSVNVADDDMSAYKFDISRDSTDGEKCEEKFSYTVNKDEETLLGTSATMTIDKGTNELTVNGKSSAGDTKTEFSGKGSIKNLTKGKCVTLQFDKLEMTVQDQYEMMEMSTAVEITEGVLDGEVTVPQGEEVDMDQEFDSKYSSELESSLMEILMKWGVLDPNDVMNDYGDYKYNSSDDYEAYDYSDFAETLDDEEVSDQETLIS